MQHASRVGGRGLSYAFVKGGSDTTKIMNLINIPTQNSAVARKMSAAASASGSVSGSGGQLPADSANVATAKGPAKVLAPKDLPLIVKNELSQVKGLKIELKDKEKERLDATGQSYGPGDAAAGCLAEATG